MENQPLFETFSEASPKKTDKKFYLKFTIESGYQRWNQIIDSHFLTAFQHKKNIHDPASNKIVVNFVAFGIA